MRRQPGTVWVLLLVPILALVACSPAESQASTHRSSSAGLDCTALVGKITDIKASPGETIGWKLSEVAGAGFQVAIPPAWNEVDTTGRQRFRAADSGTSDLVSMDVSIFPHQGKVPAIDVMINREGLSVVASIPDVLKPFQVREVALPGGSAGQLVFCRQLIISGKPVTLVFSQYFLPRRLSDTEYNNYLIQFATTDKHWHDYAQIFQSIAETFRFLSSIPL